MAPYSHRRSPSRIGDVRSWDVSTSGSPHKPVVLSLNGSGRGVLSLRINPPRSGQRGPSCTYAGRGSVMSTEESLSAELLQRAAAGDQEAVNELFSRYRTRLRVMVRLRLSRRLQGRVDPS